MDTQQFMRRRHWALVIIRIVAAATILYGSWFLLFGLGTFVGLYGPTQFVQGFSVFWSNNWNPFWYGFAVLSPGLALAVWSRAVARWIMPLPRNECPQCGYTLRQLTTKRCPECGLNLGSTNQGAAE